MVDTAPGRTTRRSGTRGCTRRRARPTAPRLHRRSAGPRPAGLGREVDLRVQRDADADRGVLLACDVAEPLDERRVARGGEAQRVGPLRERAREHRRARVLGERVARIGRDRHGDAETSGCRELLQLVVPAGDRSRGRRDAEQVEVRHALLDHVLAVRRQPEHRVGLGELAVLAHGDHRLEEEPRLLLHGHRGEQQLDALVDGQVRVEPRPVLSGCLGRGIRDRCVSHFTPLMR